MNGKNTILLLKKRTNQNKNSDQFIANGSLNLLKKVIISLYTLFP